MKRLIVAALAAVGLAGCIAVPGPYYADGGYYPAPAVGVDVYAPAYYGHRHHHHRHHRHHHRHRH